MNYYLLNLALADIGVLTTIFPFGVLKERLPNYWPLGKVVCLAICPLVDTFFGASIWFVTSIAFQRHQNIVKNKQLFKRRSTRHAVVEILAIWVASFLIVSLPLFFMYEYMEIGNGIYCGPDWRKAPHPSLHAVYTITLVVFSYVLPLGVISWTYIGIWREIRKSILFHKSLEKESGSSTRDKRSGENSRARRILKPIVVTFAFSMLPMNVFRLLSIFWKPVFMLRHFWTFYNAVVIITITNSAINPIIYSVVSRDFRKAFIQLIFKGGKPTTNGTFLFSRTKSEGVMTAKPLSFDHPQLKPQPAIISTEEWPDVDKLKETVL
ncbi:hypothetical protein QZH41_004931 [Actinostola sp. cb2023]|nr:hypothetical protein QZH41_004931 [Actinostola sp. cb2023]